MNKKQRLVHRAVAYECAQLDYLAMHNRLVAGMEERTSTDDYYREPSLSRQLELLRQGMFISRKAPSIALNSLRLLLTAKRFESSYAELHPDSALSPEELAEAAGEIIAENY